MSSEKILKKTAFGGFKKESVLNYIEELQNEILSLKKDLNNKTACESETSKLKSKVDDAELLNKKLKKQNDELTADMEHLSAVNKEISCELSVANKTIDELEEKITVYEEKFSSIEKKFSEIEAAYSFKTQELNSKASVMMNDAVKYSENLIAKANEASHVNLIKTDNAIIDALNQISSESENIRSAHLSYNSSVTTLENSIQNLSNTLLKISENIKNTSAAEAK